SVWPRRSVSPKRCRLRNPKAHFESLGKPSLRSSDATTKGAHVNLRPSSVQAPERKQDDEMLRANEERFRRYFDLGLIGMAMTSPAKRILEVNDELCRILGYE